MINKYLGLKSLGSMLRGVGIGGAARGGVALSIGTLFERALRLGSVMVLARLLTPDDFGVVAVVTMVVSLSETITDAGVRLSVIQNKEGDRPSYLNAAWWFQAIRGFGLYLICFLLSPLVAVFYENSSLTDLLRVAFVSILLNGLVSPRVYLLEREFRFAKWALLLQGSSLLGIMVTVALAYYLQSVWAIILGTVIERFFYCVTSYILCPFRPTLAVDKNNMASLFAFARGILGLPIMNFIARQADVVVLSKVVSSASLGNYYLALQLAEQPVRLFSSIVIPVLFPSVSRVQENRDNLKSMLLTMNRGLATLSIPIVALLAINASPLLSVVYGDQYADAGSALALLFLNVFPLLEISILTTIYYGLGLPHLHRFQSIKRLALIVGLMYPAALYGGIVGTAAVLVVSNAALLGFQLYNLKGILYFKPASYFGGWVLGAGLGLVVAVPSGFMLVFKTDSIILQTILLIGMMAVVIIWGVRKTARQVSP